MSTIFDTLFSSIEDTIEAHPVWEAAWSGRKIISTCVVEDVVGCTKQIVKLDPGRQAKCIASNRRKFIFLGTQSGTIALYQHIPDSSDKIRACASLNTWVTIDNHYYMTPPSLTHILTEEELKILTEYACTDNSLV